MKLMLLRFEVSNHRSIQDAVELSLVAVDRNRPEVRAFDLLHERVLAIAGIYGPNASGKSNLLGALQWLAQAVRRSVRAWDDAIPREPFKFRDGPATPSTYEVDLMVDGVRHTYHVELNDHEILTEVLSSYPERRRRVLFERQGLDITFRRGIGSSGGTRELMTRTTLALSAAMRLEVPEIDGFGRQLANIRILGEDRSTFRRGPLGVSSTTRLFEGPSPSAQASLFEVPAETGPDPRESALALLRFADLGIDDVHISPGDDEGPSGLGRGQFVARRRLHFVHRVRGQEVLFEPEEESAGTQAWFSLIGPVLSALRTGQVLLFDEIDASLHPKLSVKLLDLFRSPETNPLGAQLIFTTHDTSLLNSMNRDEVWFTEKTEAGATTLIGLAEFGGDKVRRSLNLERAYLQGRFGAVPEPDEISLRRELQAAAHKA